MIKSFCDKIKSSIRETGAINIVCFGDSVTHGDFGACYGNLSDISVFGAYPAKLHRMLETICPGRTFNVINSGIGGENATTALPRFERDVLSHHPDLVIIAFGVNDFGSKEVYLLSLGTMFDKLNELNIPCIYMTEHTMNFYRDEATVQCIYEYAAVTAKAQTDGTMDDLFDAGIAFAKEKGVYVCDVYHRWKAMHDAGIDTTRLLANRINHPIPEMHDLFVWSLIETIFFDN